MNTLTGTLFGVGLTALLLAAAITAPGGGGTSYWPSGLIVVGLGTLVASWSLLIAQNGHYEVRLREAALRLDDWATDLRRARAALGDAERSQLVGAPTQDSAPLLAEVLDRLAAAEGDDAARLVTAYQGLATPGPAAPIALDALVSQAEAFATAVAGRTIAVARAIEPHAEVAIDHARVAAMLARVLLAAEGDPPPRLEVGEWQAGLLRVQVASTEPAPPAGGLAAGLHLAASHARALGGSLEWSEASEGGTRYVLLLPLEEEDVRTDPGVG